MRVGESLKPMTPDQLKKIFDENTPDFSAEICPGATVEDMDPIAIQSFRAKWRQKSGNPNIEKMSDTQLLTDSEFAK